MTGSPELEQLRAQLAALEARLEPAAAVLPNLRRPGPVYTPPATVKLASLMSSGALRYLPVREVRQLSVAVALTRGDALPGAEVPVLYERDMLALAATRAEGLSWRAAMARCGLECPDDIEVAHQARILRGQLRLLWDQFESLLGPVQTVLSSSPVAHQNLVELLRRLFV